ncbi:MAG: hypothetical protein DU429_00630 [Candidatus Tokpelaia sp.]|nr:MAG: hypothetical protein DU430_06765 [Candidatus Tokpelaia sp.]KAA6207604.1 MAG: hypothetical protein DU429_00630 [Candidatus Tokpelaia sp.]
MVFLPEPVTNSRDYVSDDALFSLQSSVSGKALLQGKNIYQAPVSAGQIADHADKSKSAITKPATLYGYYSLKMQAPGYAFAVMCKTAGLFFIMFIMGVKQLCGKNSRPHSVLSALFVGKISCRRDFTQCQTKCLSMPLTRRKRALS